jgi:hypothetical protein
MESKMVDYTKCLGRANCGWVDGGRYVCHCFDPIKKTNTGEIRELVSDILQRVDTVRTENENMLIGALNKIKKLLTGT